MRKDETVADDKKKDFQKLTFPGNFKGEQALMIIYLLKNLGKQKLISTQSSSLK